MQKSSVTFATVLITAGLLVGCASQNHRSAGRPASFQNGAASLDSAEASFARQACQLGAAQVHLGKLASANTRNKSLRIFAKTIAEEHASNQKELDRLFASKGLDPEPALDLQSSIERLTHLKGAEFDRAFKEHVIETHEKSIAAYKNIIDHGNDPEVKAFALKTLPDLRAHLEIARNLPVSHIYERPPEQSNVGGEIGNPSVRGIAR